MNLGDHIIVGKQMFRMAKGGKIIPGRMLITKVVFQDGDEKEIEGNKTENDGLAMIVTCVKLDGNSLGSREYFSVFSARNRSWTLFHSETGNVKCYFVDVRDQKNFLF
tara:strand:- start:2225 stop:2548 length:324 start_codon:yes stop_codon:yes gene_type:complete